MGIAHGYILTWFAEELKVSPLVWFKWCQLDLTSEETGRDTEEVPAQIHGVLPHPAQVTKPACQRLQWEPVNEKTWARIAGGERDNLKSG